MNENERKMIAYLSHDNIHMAKEYAKIILRGNKAKANEDFCAKTLQRLDEKKIELPLNIQNLLFVEDTKETFNESRYYLSEREKAVADSLIKKDMVSQKLSEIGVNYVNSTMLHGESGTGKTTFGRYMAYRLDRPFAYMNFTRAIDSLLGGTAKNISAVFDFVKQWKCILMLDEIDAVGMKRGSGNEMGEMSRIVISLMQNLDRLTNDVVLIGATNRLDIIDDALLRRFSMKHEVKRLSEHERLAMARKFFGDIGFEISNDDLLRIVAIDDTQAGLMNRMVMELVDYYSKNM